ncbi:MAG: hypothetical protein LQ338_006995 [Usnochroma carphineum]|nr:MAG: hypothetical protein LQ338_006995 [Usnochroma carphineum]
MLSLQDPEKNLEPSATQEGNANTRCAEETTKSPPAEKTPGNSSSKESHIRALPKQDDRILSPMDINGLVDSTIYNAFGTFVSMQTGNTIFLGLGGATPQDTSKPYGWAKSLVSIACFCLGCLMFSHITRFFGKLRRITIVGSFLSQTLIIFVATALVQGGRVNGNLETIIDDIDWWAVLPIALLSFQSAGQIVGSRAVNLSEIPTVVLTSMLHDIFTDQKLVAKDNVKRNRRVLAFFAILIGAICGGFIGEGTDQMQIPLWIAGGLKLAITLAWTLWPEKQTSAV